MTKLPSRFHFISAETEEAIKATNKLISTYGHSSLEKADVIVALGGDGTMLQTVRDVMNTGKPIYGMNRGSVGFLMNEFHEKKLPTRIAAAHKKEIHPLRMIANAQPQRHIEALAINEVSLFRQSYQAAKIRISIDNQVRMEELICDGILVATPAGSTAYNLSAQGPILPLMAPLMTLTPVSPFRPRGWRGALLPNTATVCLDMLEYDKRPVNATADNVEVKSVYSVTISSATEITASILFDPDHSWDERILSEQFRY
ncbi:putative inorganic polyphosphate/ATP-NAD kinase [Bartonella clarridgeiae 73]|uniref:NAD kinase n=1 Tax=Bartonella clarridgeiae (strain CCUG 45776 / CIP 104772 / 73) TaxID=696125 RepID=E6YI46_BARC7|nr:NAD kinase [Bartonella clarridgeiae]WCR54894.1 MAG: NAD kinase [Bartonella clarridgeiae]CBI76534.1 putative inorganic polyphosphate/ATP-NAD kinase [Bartonella clarridgeiae 73]